MFRALENSFHAEPQETKAIKGIPPWQERSSWNEMVCASGLSIDALLTPSLVDHGR